MCDCYTHQCNEKGCNVGTPMHLGDFATERDEIRVFCEEHRWSGGVQYSDSNVTTFYLVDERQLVMVYYLTSNAVERRDQNHPNVGHRVVEEVHNDARRYPVIIEPGYTKGRINLQHPAYSIYGKKMPKLCAIVKRLSKIGIKKDTDMKTLFESLYEEFEEKDG